MHSRKGSAMNKSAMIAILATSISVMLLAQATTNAIPANKAGKTMDPATRAKLMAVTGGFVQVPAKGPAVRVVNLQTKLSSVVLQRSVDLIRTASNVPVVLVEKTGKEPATMAKETLALPETLAVIVVSEVSGQPALLVAPEEMWALINVAALTQGASPATLETRTYKEIWRALSYLLGVANTAAANTMMSPVGSLSDLDSITGQMLNAEYIMRIQQMAVKKGVSPSRMSTYKKACEEGWAPMPTNSIQKAIWEEVKAKNK